MKIALLTTTICPKTIDALHYFKEKVIPVDLVIIENSFRAKFTEAEKIFRKNHDQYNRKFKKYGLVRRISRRLWDMFPLSLQRFIFLITGIQDVLSRMLTNKHQYFQN